MKKILLVCISLFCMYGTPQSVMSSSSPVKRNIILDVDTSGDDLMALLFLLGRPDIEIRAITVVHGVSSVDAGTEMILRLLALTGHPDIPVAKGATDPLEGHNAFPAKWQPAVDHPYGLQLPPDTLHPATIAAPEMISNVINRFAGNISILALGPLTNVAVAFLNEPTLARKLNEVLISDGAVYIKGSIHMEYPAIKNTVSGWNQWVDPKATQVVFAAPVPITLVPLDITALNSPGPILLYGDVAAKYRETASGPVAQALATLLDNWITYYHEDTKINGSENRAPDWDLVAAEIFTDPGICTEWQDRNVEIRKGNPSIDGQIIVKSTPHPHVRLCLRGNQARFDSVLLQTAKSTGTVYLGKPFRNHIQEIPGRIQCELYDTGGEGISYHDADSINNGSGHLNPLNGNPLHAFRMEEGVDISYTKIGGTDDNPYNDVLPAMNQLYVGWTVPGEWIRYTVNVDEAGVYNVGLMYTSNGNGAIELDSDNGESTGIMSIPSTHKDADTLAWRQWHHWNRIDSLGNIRLRAGKQILTLKTVKNGNMNYDYLEFRREE